MYLVVQFFIKAFLLKLFIKAFLKILKKYQVIIYILVSSYTHLANEHKFNHS